MIVNVTVEKEYTVNTLNVHCTVYKKKSQPTEGLKWKKLIFLHTSKSSAVFQPGRQYMYIHMQIVGILTIHFIRNIVICTLQGGVICEVNRQSSCCAKLFQNPNSKITHFEFCTCCETVCACSYGAQVQFFFINRRYNPITLSLKGP